MYQLWLTFRITHAGFHLGAADLRFEEQAVDVLPLIAGAAQESGLTDGSLARCVGIDRVPGGIAQIAVRSSRFRTCTRL